ncbi:hypothetical membrane associated protein [Streptococcus pyogenes]|uniref:hypothetical protein n=1 Tax=Streptococcus pyogenes TaxID=1314 RepID=UPI000DA2F635|nr:hypothetical protein [Streptococcus pyogenes]UEN86710.1 hypothetical protein H7792_06975 [Streptococcus pyogenes]SQF14814.1 hypothetical membrane associated protein [Streptococcus pyogenes]VGT41334.1 hypothetical membrane associated protein [Streptococcus pyogenes]VHH57745.1 Uncharacterised protein [Streptococcus pyogenes]VHI98155.1 hypothetical membrane associated protein [Streptococcus pyogenes]
MKTKSKRFLNLATLCLALLGTTLLTTQPVKAEATPITQEVQQPDENTEDIKREYMSRYGTDLTEQDAQDRFRGYLDGYNDGLKGSNRSERNNIQVPDELKDKGNRDSEYRDGYEGGFEVGRRKNYPVQAFLEEVWDFLTGIFSSWFSGEEGSQ